MIFYYFSFGKRKEENLSFLFSQWENMGGTELTQLKKALAQKYGEDGAIHQLFKTLRKKVGQQQANAEKVAKKLFGGDENVPILLEKVKELEKVTLDFLVDIELQSDHLLKNKILTYALKKRKNADLFYRQASLQQKALRNLPLTLIRAEETWWLHHQMYHHQGAEHISRHKALFYAANEHLEFFYHLCKLRYYCEQVNLSKITKLTPEEDKAINLTRPEAFLENLKNYPFSQEPVIELYRFILLFMMNGFDLDLYEAFKTLFHQHRANLAPADVLTFIKFMLNETVRALDAGVDDMLEALHYWVKQLLQDKIILFEGSLSDSEFLNICMVLVLGGKCQELRDFINDYSEHIDDGYKADAQQLAEAQYLFCIGKFELAAQLINNSFPKYRAKEPRYHLRIKTLLMKCYLERCIADWEMEYEFERAQENLQKFIQRERRLADRYHHSYLGFLEVCWDIFSLLKKRVASKKDRTALENKVNSMKYILAKRWLLEKIQEIP